MANDVLLDGWVGANPKDYPATEEKQRFVHFDIAHRPKGPKRPNWITINGYGAVADKIVDGMQIRKGDKVRIVGFLASRYGKSPGCSRGHRFTVVVATDCLLVLGSNERPEKQWSFMPRPSFFEDDDEDRDPIFLK